MLPPKIRCSPFTTYGTLLPFKLPFPEMMTFELSRKNIFELEMSGVVRYTHYSLMIFGSNRLPLVDFFRSQAKESLSHADLVGEHITGLGGHPPINAISIKESNKHDIYEILKETLDHEKKAISTYYKFCLLYTSPSPRDS